jgi:transcriptional regulator with XRE-family HTH domain
MQVQNLKAYLANINMSIKDFCVIIDCDPKYIARIINGKSYPSKRLSKDIRIATGGIIDLPTRPKKIKEQQQKEKSPLFAI